MDDTHLKQLATQLLSGELLPDQFLHAMSRSHTADLGEVSLDVDRQRRCGFPEVVYGEGKSVATLEKIFGELLARGTPVLATRVSAEKARALDGVFADASYNELARTYRIHPAGVPRQESIGCVALITAGTSDLAVAEEARETLDWMGVQVRVLHDVGVAGPHRLPDKLGTLAGVAAVVCVAGAEGALPSVVGGYVPCPVIAVPTSVGYGAHFGGLAPLLSMLNSCAANVTVVNIDAGFKGGYIAGLIAAGRAQAIAAATQAN